MGKVAEYQSEFVVLANRVIGISESLLISFYISGLKLDLQCLLLRSNPKTLDEAFSLTRAAETRFANLDIWEFFRSNPLTLGEDFFKARITEVRFETIAKEEKEHIVEKKIDDILLLEGEFASPKAEGSVNVNEYIGVEEVVGGGEALKVGDDELSRVISTLKDGGGEFDSRLDEINLNLSEELADSQSAYSSYHLEGKVIFEGVGSVMALVAEGGIMVLCYVQSSGRRKRKKVLVTVAEGRRTTGVEDRSRIGIRIWDPGIKRNFSRPHLEDKVISKEWGMIRPELYVMLHLFRICVCVVLGNCHCLDISLCLACFTTYGYSVIYTESLL
jgi:hypothetical protein